MNKKNAFWGLFFIFAAVLVIVQQLGYFQEISFFKVVFSIMLAAILIKSVVNVSFGGILFSLAFLCILYDGPLGIESLTPWPVLCAALFGTIGLNLIFKNHGSLGTDKNAYKWNHNRNDFPEPKEAAEQLDGEKVYFMNRFGASVKYIVSQQLEQANLKCSFGGMQAYFDKADLKDMQAVIYVDISFSGVELYFPKEWSVVNEVDVTLAGVDMHNAKGPEPGAKTVYLRGSVSLGGLDVYFI